MTKKLTVRNIFLLITVLLAAVLLVLKLNEFVELNKTVDSLNSGNSASQLVNQLIKSRNLTVIEIIIISSFIIFMSLSIYFIIKNLISEIKLNERIISETQKELENHYDLINNLSNLYSDAMENDKIKTEFFSNMSHELKTPLSVILGAIQLMGLKTKFISDDRRKSNKHLKTIKQNCYRLVRLINNILDITRIDSGYIKMNIVNCNVVYLVEEITQSVLPYAEQKGINLVFDTDEEEIMAGVDIDKIERIVLNILSNAIKFTESNGKVFVNIKSSNNNSFCISIKDTGMGISSELQGIIFERFRQGDNSLTGLSEGSGIGLSLVKSFVELHKGTIRLISEKTQGSEFIVEIPIQLCESSSVSEPVDNNYRNKIIEAINIEFSDIYSIAS